MDDVKEQNSVLQTKANDHNHSMLTMSKKLNRSEVKKYVDAFLVIIGLLIIIGTVIYYLFYNLNSMRNVMNSMKNCMLNMMKNMQKNKL